jgi:translation elongation factor EF-Tu-like GTPase
MSSNSGDEKFVHARLRFLTSAEGGRFTPPMSGVRSQLDLGDFMTSCIVRSVTDMEVFPLGESVDVVIELIFPDVHGVKLEEMTAVRLYEGNKLVATGGVVHHDSTELSES